MTNEITSFPIPFEKIKEMFVENSISFHTSKRKIRYDSSGAGSYQMNCNLIPEFTNDDKFLIGFSIYCFERNIISGQRILNTTNVGNWFNLSKFPNNDNVHILAILNANQEGIIYPFVEKYADWTNGIFSGAFAQPNFDEILNPLSPVGSGYVKEDIKNIQLNTLLKRGELIYLNILNQITTIALTTQEEVDIIIHYAKGQLKVR